MKIEVIVSTVKEAIDAEIGGADRLELISGVAEGGITPSISLIISVCNAVNIPVNVMVRPHSKSFVYDEYDKQVILNDIQMIKETNANGIVFGSLNENGLIDTDMLDEVISIKGNKQLAFHRAIDSSKDYYGDMKKLFTRDIDIILTSAGKGSVIEGDEHFADFTKSVYGKKPALLLGSGVNSTNHKEITSKFKTTQIHIGSGVKYNRDNFAEIDIDTLRLIKESY